MIMREASHLIYSELTRSGEARLGCFYYISLNVSLYS